MFKCQECNKTSQPRTRQNRITIEKRERNYYNIIVKHKIVKHPKFLQYERKDINIIRELERQGWKTVHENFSKGTEIIREKILCEDCYKRLEKLNETAKK